MRPSLVNGLAFVAACILAGTACTRNADGRSGPTTGAGAAPHAGVASATPPARAAAPDSLARLADLGRIQGSPSARVWLVEVSDLQCPFCKEWHDQTYPAVYAEYVKTGKVRMAYVNFPLPEHQNAQAAATAAMCASAQGKFWPVHDSLFASQAQWENLPDPGSYFNGVMARAGVNMTAYHTCLTSPAIQALISADKDRAERAGVGATPTFLINAGGKTMPPIEGAVPLADIQHALNAALAAAH